MVMGGAVATSWAAQPPPWPGDGVVERSWGVDIHFTQAQEGELALLAASGAGRARTDLSWTATETAPGQYDFSTYEKLADDLAAQGVRPWFVLDYQNPLYERQRAVDTAEARAAFARWAGAAAAKLRGRGVIWEIWNEPNNAHAWKPAPDPPAYAALALAATQAIKAADPEATVVGPAAALVDLPFLQYCGEAGLFGLWDAVTVHPYRREAPESAADDFRQARTLIRLYTPPGKTPPVLLAGEWGYSTAWAGINDDVQAAYVARMELADLAEGVPLTIWHDWEDDGPDPGNSEHNFGLLHTPRQEHGAPVLPTKPAYEAAAALYRQLRYYQLNKALTQQAGYAHLLVFARRPEAPAELPPYKIVVWTAHPDGHEMVAMPIGPGRYQRTDGRGRVMLDAVTTGPSLRMQVDALPQYLTPAEVSPRLHMLAAWQRWPREYLIEPGMPAMAQTTWVNGSTETMPFAPQVDPDPWAGSTRSDVNLYPSQSYVQTTAPVTLPASGTPVKARAGLEGWWQETWLTPAKTMHFAMTPLGSAGLTVSVPNATGGQLNVTAGMDRVSAAAATHTAPAAVVPAKDFTPAYGTEISATLTDEAGRLVAQDNLGRVARVPMGQGPAGSPSGLRTVPDGGQYSSGDVLARWAVAPDAAQAPAPLALKVDFSSGQGLRYYRFEPGLPAGAADWPKRVGFWIYGDDAPVRLTLRVHDATGQTFQPWAVQVTGKRWQAVWVDLDPARCDHWGAADDGKPIPPIAWDCYFILNKVGEAPTKQTIYLLPPTLVFAPQ
jgi:hypothetical protein